MPDWLTLRRRFALFFAAIAIGGSVLFAGGLWLGYSHAGGPSQGYVSAWLAGSFALLGLVAWIGFLFDENVARPIKAVATDLQTRARSDVSVDIDQAPGRYLGALAPAAQAIHQALDTARKREAEILNGGSIYWVVQGVIQCRQKIVRLDEVIGSDGIRRCAIVLTPEVIRTSLAQKRPFQGWRYLQPADAPADLPRQRQHEEALPAGLSAELADIGVI